MAAKRLSSGGRLIGRGPRLGHPGLECRRVRRTESEAQLGAAPQHILGGARPFFVHQPGDLGFAQIGAEQAPEVGETSGARQDLRRARPIGADQPPRMGFADEGVGGAQGTDEVRDPVDRKLAARQRRIPGPSLADRQEAPKQFQRLLREAAIGGHLAAEHRQERRLAVGGVEFEHVVARRLLRPRRAVVVERPQARIGPDDGVLAERRAEIVADRGDEIGDLGIVGGDVRGIAVEILVRGADQREVAMEGYGEDDASVGVLEDVGAAVIEQPPDDDMAALDQPDAGAGVGMDDVVEHVGDPRPGGIDQGAGRDDLPFPGLHRFERQLPAFAFALGDDAAGARIDARAPRAGVDGVEHHEARIVDRAIGILEGEIVAGPERLAGRVFGELQGARRREELSAAEMVVDEKAEPEQPGRTEALMVRQDETERPDDVRRRPPAAPRAPRATRAPGGRHSARDSAIRHG